MSMRYDLKEGECTSRIYTLVSLRLDDKKFQFFIDCHMIINSITKTTLSIYIYIKIKDGKHRDAIDILSFQLSIHTNVSLGFVFDLDDMY